MFTDVRTISVIFVDLCWISTFFFDFQWISQETDRQEASEAQRGPYDSLSIAELRAKIHAKTGKKTRKQNRDSLLAILNNFDQEKDYEPDGEARGKFISIDSATISNLAQ